MPLDDIGCVRRGQVAGWAFRIQPVLLEGSYGIVCNRFRGTDNIMSGVELIVGTVERHDVIVCAVLIVPYLDGADGKR